MKYGIVPGVTKPVSRLVQGTIMANYDKLDETFALYDSFFEAGCNTFDTAHIYGNGANERAVGKWINARGIREKVVLIGKGAHHMNGRRRVTPEDISQDIKESLERLQFDYIDLYLLHRDDPGVPVGPIVEILNEHVKAGRIRAFGGSNWTAQRIQDANQYAAAHGLIPFVASSPQYSLARQVVEPWENCVSISGPAGEWQQRWYKESKVALFCWSSLAGGWFSGRVTREKLAPHKDTLYYQCYCWEDNLKRLDRVYQLASDRRESVPMLALAYVLNQPMDIFALVGCESGAELKVNIRALEMKLTQHELDWLDLKRETP